MQQLRHLDTAWSFMLVVWVRGQLGHFIHIVTEGGDATEKSGFRPFSIFT
jgi:hypothetical protein